MPKLILYFSGKNRWLYVVSIALIMFAVYVAYQPVMFNFFVSDDFYILRWLSDAQENFSTLFQGQYIGTPYYRPLLNVLLYFEFLLCGLNSSCFRLIALGYQFIAAIVLFLLLREIRKPDNRWALFSVGLFLLYPLHTEPINWFVCTTEVIANLFMLSAILFYFYWRKQRSYLWGLCSLICTVFAFLTKEATVTLPVVLVIGEILLHPHSLKKIKGLFIDILHTLPHWLTLVSYLILRKIATGRFVGSWNNTVFHFPDHQSMYKAWWQSLKMIFIPISSAAFSDHIFALVLHIIWLALLILLIYFTIRRAKENREISLLLFFICWFFICLLPMYKLLLITPDLLDARYGYLASVPLCAFLMYGLATKRIATFFLVLFVSGLILRANNIAWAETGNITNNLLSEFSNIHKQINGDPLIYFTNIPVSYNGVAIAGLKSIDSMNGRPFLARDYSHCIWLANQDQSLPIGIMKHTLEQGNTGAYYYYFSMRDRHFHPVLFSKKDSDALFTKFAVKGSEITFTDVDLNCWATDYIAVKATIKNIANTLKSVNVQMDFANDASGDITSSEKISVPLDLSKKEEVLIFPVRGIPAWSFGGVCSAIRVVFPKGCTATINGAYAGKLEKDMPELIFPGINYNKNIGQLNINTAFPEGLIKYNCAGINRCAGVALEVLGPGENFKQLNSLRSETYSRVNLMVKGPTGIVRLKRAIFPSTGTYKARLKPIDKEDSQVGFCSDHFILEVTK